MSDMDTETDILSTPGADVIQLPQEWRGVQGSGPIAQVEAYWHALRGSRLVPERADVDPRGIEGALSYSFIAERIAPGHARIRIAGQHLSDILGMEVRGMPLSALFEPDARPRLQEALYALFDGPSALKFRLKSGAGIGKPALSGRMILYPLRNDMGEISRALGCIVTDGEIGRAPRRFGISFAHETELEAKTSMPPIKPMTSRRVGMAEEKATFERTGVPYLRVVSKDED